MNTADGEKIHLDGTPCRERFDFLWDILINGVIGLVLLLNIIWADTFKIMKFYLNSFGSCISETSVSIGVTQLELRSNRAIAEFIALNCKIQG